MAGPGGYSRLTILLIIFAVVAAIPYILVQRVKRSRAAPVASATTTSTLALVPAELPAAIITVASTTTTAPATTTTTAATTTTTAPAKAAPPAGEAAKPPAGEGGSFWFGGSRPSNTKYDQAKQAEQEKDYARAIEVYGEFIKENAGSSLVPFAQYNIAWNYRNMKDREKAMAAYRKLLDDYPASKPAEWGRIEMKDYEKQAGKEKK